jgi:molecular chaperone HscB
MIDTLDTAYRALQRRVHPDRYATAGETERRLALQSAARVNEAYRALKDPVKRAQHLLSLHGIEALGETDTALPADFLQDQLARREALAEAEAERIAPLAALLEDARSEIARLEAALADDLDAQHALDAARDTLRKLRFLTKVSADIETALSGIED